MKKYLLALLNLLFTLFVLSAPAFANDLDILMGPKKTVAVFVEFMQTMYGVSEGTKLVSERIGDIIPTGKLSLIPLEKSMRQLTFWKEDNVISVVGGWSIVRVPKEGLIETAQKLGEVDYIASIIITSDMPTYAGGIGVVAERQRVTLYVRIIDPKNGEYLTYTKVDASEKGKTGAMGAVGNPAVFLKTLNAAIDQIALDVSGL